MKCLVIALCVVVLAAGGWSATLQGSGGRAFEQELRALLEQLRGVIVEGSPDNGVPVLDPFQWDLLDLSTEIPDTATITLKVKDLEVVGLKDFIVDNISFNVLRLRLDFDFTLPSTKASFGEYDLLAMIMDYALFGQGDGSVEAVNFRFHGFATLSIKDGHLHMSNFNINFELESFKSNINGLLGGGDVSDVLNEIVQVLVPALIESQGEMISETVGQIVKDAANRVLENMTLQDLIDWITGEKLL